MSDEIKPVPFKKILDPQEFSNGDIIKCIRGTITGIYEVRKGTGQKGDYEYQNATMKDDEGTEMRLTFSSCTQPQSAKGKRVTIKSVNTPTHGKQGVKLEEDSYEKDGQTVMRKQIRITKAANIVYDGGAPSEQKASGNGSGGKAQSNGHPKEVLKDMLDLHTTIATLVNERYPAEGMDAFRSSAISTIFIESARQGLIPDFAKRFGQKIIPPAPSDPTQWKTCVIPKGSLEGKTLDEAPDEDLLRIYSALVDADSKSNFAKCVYQAVQDRDILPKHQPETGAPEEDDIPWN